MSAILWVACQTPTLVSDLPAIAALGFDSIIVVDKLYPKGLSDYATIMPTARSAGLKVYPDVQKFCCRGSVDTASLTTWANTLSSYPALGGWYVNDEAMNTYTVPQRQQVYSLLKSITPSAKVVENEWYIAGDYYRPTGTHDIFAGDSYPFWAGDSVAQAVHRLQTEVGSPSCASGLQDYKNDIAAYGWQTGNDLSWWVQVANLPGKEWPPSGGVTAEVQAIVDGGWATSGTILCFAWTDNVTMANESINSANTLRGQTFYSGSPSPDPAHWTAFAAEVSSAIAPFYENPYASLSATAHSDHISLLATGTSFRFVERRVIA